MNCEKCFNNPAIFHICSECLAVYFNEEDVRRFRVLWRDITTTLPEDKQLIAVCKKGDWGTKLAYYETINHDMIFRDGDNLWCYMPVPPK